MRDVLGYYRYLKYYKEQGIKFVYNPLLGWSKWFIRPKEEKNQLQGYLDFFKNNDSPLIAVNAPDSFFPYLMIRDPKLCMEFYQKDIEVSKKFNSIDIKLNNCFVIKSGPEAMRQRGIMANFFKEKNMKEVTPQLTKLIQKLIEKIKKENFDETDCFKKINVDPYIDQLFINLVAQILFGMSNEEEELKEIAWLSASVITDSILVFKNILNLFTHNLASKLKLIPLQRKIDRNYELCCIKIKQVYSSRKNDKSRKKGINIMDLMIKFNEDCEARGKPDEMLTKEDIIGNCFGLFLAAIDTSKSVTRALLATLSANSKVRVPMEKMVNTELFKNDPNGHSSDTYIHNKLLTCFVSEGLRMYNPVVLTFPRIVTKNFKLGKFKIFKGTIIGIPNNHFHYTANLHLDEMVFNLTRFEEEKRKKMSRMSMVAFGLGKRSCIGRFLAELQIGGIVANFLKEFEFKEVGEFEGKQFEPEFKLEASYELKKCVLNLRVKG
jgi:cytochrome P450